MKMRTIRNISDIYAVSVITASVFVFCHMIIVASMNNWIITLDFNSVNEGVVELVFALSSIPSIVWMLVRNVKALKGE